MSTQSNAIAAVQQQDRAQQQNNGSPEAIEAKRAKAVDQIKRSVASLIDGQQDQGVRALILLRDVTAAVGSGAVPSYDGTLLNTDKAFRQWISDNLNAVLPAVDAENATVARHPRVAATQAVKATVRASFAIAAWLNRAKVRAVQLVGDPASRVRIPSVAFAGFDKAKRDRFIFDGDESAALTFAGAQRAADIALASEGTRADAASTALAKATKVVRALWAPSKASDGTFVVSPVGAKLRKAFADLLAECAAAESRRKNAPAQRKASKAPIVKLKAAAKRAERKAQQQQAIDKPAA